MSGLSWVRVDTQFAMNPKILMLVEDKAHRAINLYVFGLGYCGAQGTDGFVPKGALRFLHATKRDADKLVEVGLWVPNPAGWDVNGWRDYQPSSEETQRRKDKARKAAEVRWASQRQTAQAVAD